MKDDDYSYSYRIEKQLKKLREYEKFKEIKNNNISALCYSDRLIHYQNKKSIIYLEAALVVV